MGLEELLENVLFAATIGGHGIDPAAQDRAPGAIGALWLHRLRILCFAHNAACEVLVARYGMPDQPWVILPLFALRMWGPPVPADPFQF